MFEYCLHPGKPLFIKSTRNIQSFWIINGYVFNISAAHVSFCFQDDGSRMKMLYSEHSSRSNYSYHIIFRKRVNFA